MEVRAPLRGDVVNSKSWCKNNYTNNFRNEITLEFNDNSLLKSGPGSGALPIAIDDTCRYLRK